MNSRITIKKIIDHIKWRINFITKIKLPQIILSSFLKREIKGGIFKGIKYIPSKSYGSLILPMLLGTYENELNSIIKNLDFNSYDIIVDIGAAEGYYVIGLASKFFNGKIIAFETSKKSRESLKKLSKLNNVFNQIEIRGKCELTDIREVVDQYQKPFMIVDIEGFESELLNPNLVPNLSKVELLVELHPLVIGDIENILTERFSKTHHITIIAQEFNKVIEEHIELPLILKKYESILTNEYRMGNLWYYMKPI